MELLILSEMQAIDYATKLTVPTSIVSITCPLDDKVVFKHNGKLKNVFHMQFNDIVVKNGDFDCPQQEDFAGLKNFIDKLDCELLIVHCFAGVSRSAATAAAIAQYLGIEKEIFDNEDYDPNPLVYKLACKELNIEPVKGA